MSKTGVAAQESAPVQNGSSELTRTLLAVLGLLALIAGSLWVLRPFIPAFIWAVTIVIATWPLLGWVQSKAWNRRDAAVFVMTGGLLLLFFVPLAVAFMTLARHTDWVVLTLRGAAAWQPVRLPAWMLDLPWIGARIDSLWQEWQALGAQGWLTRVTPYLGSVAAAVLKELGALGALAVQGVLTIPLAALLYVKGETAGAGVLQFAHRLAGDRGTKTVRLAADAIRGVALGVVVTAVVQALLGGLGLAVAGVPAVAFLTALMFFFALAQIGVIPVLLPAVVWLFWSEQTGWGVALLVWMLWVATLDNFLRPWLIQRGVDLPLWLVFFGVVGGFLALGLLGVFLGPVILAITWTLLAAWVAEDRQNPEQGAGGEKTPPCCL